MTYYHEQWFLGSFPCIRTSKLLAIMPFIVHIHFYMVLQPHSTLELIMRIQKTAGFGKDKEC
jgi:hypothetical protein